MSFGPGAGVANGSGSAWWYPSASATAGRITPGCSRVRTPATECLPPVDGVPSATRYWSSPTKGVVITVANGPTPTLYGRRSEREALTELIRAARTGHSGVLVLQGESGIGKTALLEHMADLASACRVLRVTGVESEMELAFAALHQLCRPLLVDGLDRLPAPQADALATALGLRSGQPPDKFLVGLAALSLLSEGARDRPLVCLVDDAQWLDQASAQTLMFVARRLEAEAVILVIATRGEDTDQTGWRLPVIRLHGLTKPDAEALLESTTASPLDTRVSDRIIAETRGNPLALREVPRWFSATEMTFGPHPIGTLTLTSRMKQAVRRELDRLPPSSRLLLLAAAAEPLGDPALLWSAAERLGLERDAAAALEEAGLLEIREAVVLRHPLVRAVVYQSAAPTERLAVHRALAEVTDRSEDPDRRAWHLAHAAAGPDESVAEELENSADRAARRGGLTAAAAFLERSVRLTVDPAARTRRQLDTIQAMVHAGAFDAASSLAAAVTGVRLSDAQHARLEKMRAQIEFASRGGNEALPRLLVAARRLEEIDVEDALDLYVDGLTAAMLSSRLGSKVWATEVAHAVRRAPVPTPPRRVDLLLQAVAALYVEGYPAAVPSLKQAVAVFDDEGLSLEQGLRWLYLASSVAAGLWDDSSWDRLARRHLEIVRHAGALSALPLALNTRIVVDVFTGNLAAATRSVEEFHAFHASSESAVPAYGAVALAAFRGREDARQTIGAVLADAVERGEGSGATFVRLSRAVLCNALGLYREVLEDGREALVTPPEEVAVATWWLVELIEAAARAGEITIACEGFENLAVMTRASGTDWALGVTARCEALLHDGNRADVLYRESISRLGRTLMRPALARAQLLYGEWLRRKGRRVDAREQLREAYDLFALMGMEAFAERSRRELLATGEKVRKRIADAPHALTPQELHIAGLAAEGLTNPDIASELFISPRTVEWHLGKVFGKLGITSRRQLREVIRQDLPSA